MGMQIVMILPAFLIQYALFPHVYPMASLMFHSLELIVVLVARISLEFVNLAVAILQAAMILIHALLTAAATGNAQMLQYQTA